MCQSTQIHKRHLCPPDTMVAVYKSPTCVEITFICRLLQIRVFLGKLISSPYISVTVRAGGVAHWFCKAFFIPASTYTPLSSRLWPLFSLPCVGCGIEVKPQCPSGEFPRHSSVGLTAEEAERNKREVVGEDADGRACAVIIAPKTVFSVSCPSPGMASFGYLKMSLRQKGLKHPPC